MSYPFSSIMWIYLLPHVTKLLEILNDRHQQLMRNWLLWFTLVLTLSGQCMSWRVMVLSCYKQILKIHAAIQCGHYPNVQAICSQEFLRLASVAWLFNCVCPTRVGLFSGKAMKWLSESNGSNQGSKAASKVNEMKPMATDVNDLWAFPFLEEHLNGLKAELPTYLALATGVDESV